MSEWLLFVLCVLACYRLSHMLAGELGPANIFKKMRMKTSPKHNLGKGIRCVHCWGVWISALITAGLWWVDFVPTVLTPLYAFAISGMASLIHKLDD